MHFVPIYTKTQRLVRDCVHGVQATIHAAKRPPARLSALPRGWKAFPRRKCTVPSHVPFLEPGIYLENANQCSDSALQKRRDPPNYSDLYTIHT